MSLDPRSRERLEALGRQLPQPLPAPQPKPIPSAARHPVETEQNPERLFRELMAASPDGSVPPHLLERLKHLEAKAVAPGKPPVSAAPPPTTPQDHRRNSPRRKPETQEDQQLYATFAQLLLEQEEEEV
jgi:hypothetical protein